MFQDLTAVGRVWDAYMEPSAMYHHLAFKLSQTDLIFLAKTRI